jgi:hypothetical protein
VHTSMLVNCNVTCSKYRIVLKMLTNCNVMCSKYRIVLKMSDPGLDYI